MKKLIPLFLFFLIPSALATNITMSIQSNETININQTISSKNTNLITNVVGNLNWWINGYPGKVPVIKKGLDFNDLIYRVKTTIDFIFGLTTSYDTKAMEFLYQLSRIFVTKSEMNYYQRSIEDLQIRVRMLENTIKIINETAYCQGKIDTMVEYNLTSVKCGKTTYSIQNGKIIGVTPL